MEYHLDTDICSAAMRGVPEVSRRLLQRAGQLDISTIVLAELYAGCYHSKRRDENRAVLEEFIAGVEVLHFDAEAAREHGLIYAELLAVGRPTGEKDGLIAAVARARSGVMVTHNVRHYENISGLVIEDWLLP
jgi:predicted nucleic acid-binding protein